MPKSLIFSNLTIIRDDNGPFRVKSQLTFSEGEDVNYTYLVLLNGKQELVKKLIWEIHLNNRHAAVVTVMVELHKSYWIVKARRNIKQVLVQTASPARASRSTHTIRPQPHCYLLRFTPTLLSSNVTSIVQDPFISQISARFR